MSSGMNELRLNEYGRLKRVALAAAGAGDARPGQDRSPSGSRSTTTRAWISPSPWPSTSAWSRSSRASAPRSSICRPQECPHHGSASMCAMRRRSAPRGVILCNMGKPARSAEPGVHGEHLQEGRHSGRRRHHRRRARSKAAISSGWTRRHVGIARGYRTNAEGIRQFKEIVGGDVHVEVAVLPHYKGQSDVFHLMSMISPSDEKLQLVYSPLMPVPFREWLLDHGHQLVEVPDEEFA